MQIYYAPDIVDSLVLPEEESSHCVRVLRKRVGDELLIADGKGAFYTAHIVDAHPKRTTVEIISVEKQEPLWNYKVEIALAPTKNMDRVEWFAEKATEIGIDKISFLRCAHSERREIKTERIRKIVRSAMKQSQKAYLPEVAEMMNFNMFVEIPFDGAKFIAHCEETAKQVLVDVYKKASNALVLIGPEGDFSSEEIILAKEQGFLPVSLGQSRLRTETAAIVACHTIHLCNEIA